MLGLVLFNVEAKIDYLKNKFNNVGWFIPPYVQMGYLVEIAEKTTPTNHTNLESFLAEIYTSGYLASMVTERYPVVPIVKDYSKIISESIEAHFLGLQHVSVSGLIPVVEGAGSRIAESKGLNERYIKEVFVKLADYCKKDVIENNIGAVSEISAMLDSFVHLTKKNLYIKSEKYLQTDKTNRHGILHGSFSDNDYGSPLNFYKAIGAIDFLCFIVSIRASISFLAPNRSSKSMKLNKKYELLDNIKHSNL